MTIIPIDIDLTIERFEIMAVWVVFPHPSFYISIYDNAIKDFRVHHYWEARQNERP